MYLIAILVTDVCIGLNSSPKVLSTRNQEMIQDAEDVVLDDLPQTKHQSGSCKHQDQEHCNHESWEGAERINLIKDSQTWWYQALLCSFTIGLQSQMMKAARVLS